MKVVIIRLLCAAIVLVAIAITYVVLQAFGKKESRYLTTV